MGKRNWTYEKIWLLVVGFSIGIMTSVIWSTWDDAPTVYKVFYVSWFIWLILLFVKLRFEKYPDCNKNSTKYSDRNILESKGRN